MNYRQKKKANKYEIDLLDKELNYIFKWLYEDTIKTEQDVFDLSFPVEILWIIYYERIINTSFIKKYFNKILNKYIKKYKLSSVPEDFIFDNFINEFWIEELLKKNHKNLSIEYIRIV